MSLLAGLERNITLIYSIDIY